jgi:sulfhydrogenase subunit delta
MTQPRPTLAVYKFSSCDGCQLSILNLEDELLDLAEALDVAYFLEATRSVHPGPYDIAIVEGSVTTDHEVERIQEIRRGARMLIALGTCAAAGGIQALRNFADPAILASTVYPHAEYLNYLPNSRPLSDCVKVDLELWGCPVNKSQVAEVLVALLHGRRPNLPVHSVCLDCKRRGNPCVLVQSGSLCLGPVTQAGCGAICPALGRGCYACFGPARGANVNSLADVLRAQEGRPGETARLFRGISGFAPAFREAGNHPVTDRMDTE